MHKTGDALSPTAQLYGELQKAYAFFNDELFEGKLPPCVMTIPRQKHTRGYFAYRRFENSDGSVRDELALNPAYFATRSLIEVLSTLVHEQTHVWQFHFGKASRVGYHNRQWAEKMLWAGLHPSDTGKPGGRMLGQRMMHYITTDGRFEVSAKKLIATGFALSWFDTKPAIAMPRGLATFLQPNQRAGRRTKFICLSQCGTQAWGKPSLHIICGTCEQRMLPEGQ